MREIEREYKDGERGDKENVYEREGTTKYMCKRSECITKKGRGSLHVREGKSNKE